MRLIEAFNVNTNVTPLKQTIYNKVNNHFFMNKHLLNLPNNKIQCGLTLRDAHSSSGEALYQCYMKNSMLCRILKQKVEEQNTC